MKELNEFLQGEWPLWLVKYDDYLTYKEILKNEKFIVPIQFMITDDQEWNEWNKSNEGFYDQLTLIDNTLSKIK